MKKLLQLIGNLFCTQHKMHRCQFSGYCFRTRKILIVPTTNKPLDMFRFCTCLLSSVIILSGCQGGTPASTTIHAIDVQSSTPPPSFASATFIPTLTLTPLSTATPIPETTPTTLLPSPTPTVYSPISTLFPNPGTTLEGHPVVLTIHNVDKLTGYQGQPTRWLGWGAPAFTIAPDGSYWLLDINNALIRLVHLDPLGNVLLNIPVPERMRYLQYGYYTDIVASQNLVWVKGPSSSSSGNIATEIFQFDIQGNFLTHFDFPEQHGTIILGSQGELLFESLDGCAGLEQIVSAQGELAQETRSGYEWAGHHYALKVKQGEPCSYTGDILVDGQTVTTIPEAQNSAGYGLALLGAAADGRFYVQVGFGMDQGIIQHFALDGTLLGQARPPVDYFQGDLQKRVVAIGPDGELYVLVSQLNQNVEIVQLQFTTQLSPAATPVADLLDRSTPIPAASAWETPPAGASDEAIARETLIRFLSLLSEERFPEAAQLYGGSYADSPTIEALKTEERIDLSDLTANPAPETYWERLCFGPTLACLPASTFRETEIIADGTFRFWVELVMEVEGKPEIFTAPYGMWSMYIPQHPPAWIFPFTVKKVDGQYQVMDMPPIVRH